jgi:hypothetical protein
VEVIREYTEWRARFSGDAMWVTIKPPHTEVTKATVSRVRGRVLRAANIDKRFTPGSLRSAVLSGAQKGTEKDRARKSGRWAKASRVCETHYDRPVLRKKEDDEHDEDDDDDDVD